MSSEPVIVIRLRRRSLVVFAVVLAILASIALPSALHAQKVQETFKEKLDIADTGGGVSVAVSADGKYVYVAGPEGVIASDDFGKTGTWVQTARFK
jgi:hypothetical protein